MLVDEDNEGFSIMRQRAWGLYLETDREYVTRVLNKMAELFGSKTVRNTESTDISSWLLKVNDFMQTDDYKHLNDTGKQCFKNHVLSISREIIRKIFIK